MQKDIYAEAYQAGYKKTTSYLRARGADPITADELSQAAWAKGWERLSQLRNESSVLQWVNTIARRELATCFRGPRLVDLAEMNAEPAVATLANVSKIDMMRGLQKCKPHQRQLIEAFLTGYTNSEIARQAGKSLGAIHADLSRARRVLREQMRVPPRQVLKDPGVFKNEDPTRGPCAC